MKTSVVASLCVLFGSLVVPGSLASADAPVLEQSVMGPGIYMFQMRVDTSSCGDTDKTGYVNSYFAMLDGVPGSRSMDMQLTGTAYWPHWTLAITASGQVIGDAEQAGNKGAAAATSHFELKQEGRRFKGRGSRSYTATVAGKPQRCSISYDALLQRIDS